MHAKKRSLLDSELHSQQFFSFRPADSHLQIKFLKGKARASYEEAAEHEVSEIKVLLSGGLPFLVLENLHPWPRRCRL